MVITHPRKSYASCDSLYTGENNGSTRDNKALKRESARVRAYPTEMMKGARHRDNTRDERFSTGLQPPAWVSPTPLGALRGQLPGAKGNPRARKYEIVRLILIGEAITKCSVSDGHSLNGRSST